MPQALPNDARELMDSSWADLEPHYEELIQRPLTADTSHSFLSDWTRLTELIDETFSRLHVATTVNTADEASEKRLHRFLDEIYPKVEQAEDRLKRKMTALDTGPAGFEISLLKMRTEAELFREENLPLFVEEHKLGMEYDKIIGAQTVEWEGKEITVVQLRPVFQNSDRSLRERAWRLAAGRRLEDSEAIGELWRKFMAVRIKEATNAGFQDYRSFRWKQLLRFDYGPDDCKRFHSAIEQVVVPVAARVYERRRKRLGLEKLRPWDLEVDPAGRPPLVPFRDAGEFPKTAAEMFRKVDPQFGSYFDTMIQEGLLDLENRKHKAPGGYCTEFAASKRPFIFMNAVGVHDDVQTILHEAGHSFHAFERDSLPYYQQRQIGMEFAEVASMAMELLAGAYLERSQGGFYSKEDAARARVEHLERSILFWPYMAVVDAFQHWVYENPSKSVEPSECDRQWAFLWHRFMPEFDWSGLEDVLQTGWQQKLHIHTVPFYYVEYGLAQLGAVLIWGNARRDRNASVAAYRKALSLGGTVSLPELFKTAGAQFSFSADTLETAVTLMEQAIKEESE